MSINIGLDIGAVSLKLAAIGAPSDEALFRNLGDKSATFFAASFPASSPFAGRPFILSRYRRILGSPIQSTFDLLQELYEYLPEENVEGIRVTGSGSQLLAKILGIYFENEFRAIAKGVRIFNSEVRTIFEIGGESSKYLRLDPEAVGKHLGIVDYQTSGECAAGTGSFIDQQATRLLYSVEQVGAAACGASCAARIAGRCSVFAKTDMIHAQQKGYTTEQILRGLCDAVARNFKSSIVKGRAVVAPVALIGGVALNAGISNALGEAFKLGENELVVPELYAWLGAAGAAMLEAEEWRKRSFKRIHQLRQHEAAKKSYACSEALSMKNVLLLRDLVAPAGNSNLKFQISDEIKAEPSNGKSGKSTESGVGVSNLQSQVSNKIESEPSNGKSGKSTESGVGVSNLQSQISNKIEAYLGIDIGSVSTNLVVIDAAGNLLKEIYLPTQGRPIEVVDRGLKEIEAETRPATRHSRRGNDGVRARVDRRIDRRRHRQRRNHRPQDRRHARLPANGHGSGGHHLRDRRARLEVHPHREGRRGGLHHERGLRGGHRVVPRGAGRKAGDFHQGGVRTSGPGLGQPRPPG